MRNRQQSGTKFQATGEGSPNHGHIGTSLQIGAENQPEVARFSTPEEVATLVALLASPRTANVTGANYVIDGGLAKTT